MLLFEAEDFGVWILVPWIWTGGVCVGLGGEGRVAGDGWGGGDGILDFGVLILIFNS